MKSIEQFVPQAIKIHGNKYDYSLVVLNNNERIKIICDQHGVFEQKPKAHLNGSGCIRCNIIRSCSKFRSNATEFRTKAIRIHGYLYDYSNVNYINNYTKIMIICKTHGGFWQRPEAHLKGFGCKKCKDINRRIGTKKFIELANLKHNHKYDYSKVNYTTGNNKVIIICKKHGEFLQAPRKHLENHGCILCGLDNHTISLNEFINRSKLFHGNKYDYSKVDYVGYHDNVIIICKEHGEFKQQPQNHWNGHGCPKCRISNGHQSLINYINSIYNDDILVNNRQVLDGLEIDIYLPNLKFGIEFNGLRWHSYNKKETLSEKFKHQIKSQLANDKDIILYQFSEFDWNNKQDIVKSMIANKLGLSSKLYARNLQIVECSNTDAINFYNGTHLYGGRPSLKNYCLMKDGEIVSCMSFSKHHKYQWEIIRYATKLNTVIVGGASRLFRKFLVDHSPELILAYADYRFSVGGVYSKLGFSNDGLTKPGYCYTIGNSVYSRQQFQKHKLSKKLEIFDPILSESQNMFNNGYRRLWDAGHLRMLWEKQ